MKATLIAFMMVIVVIKSENLFQSLEKSFREKSGGLHCISILWMEHVDKDYFIQNLVSLETSWFLTPIEVVDDKTDTEHVCLNVL